MAVELKCQGCGAILSADASAGAKIACPQCKTPLIVPGGPKAGDPEAPVRDPSAGVAAPHRGEPALGPVPRHARGAAPDDGLCGLGQHAGCRPARTPASRSSSPGSAWAARPAGPSIRGPSDDPLDARQNIDPQGDTGFSTANEMGIGVDVGGATSGLDLVGSTAGEAGRLAAAIGGVGTGLGSGAGGPMAPFSPIASGSGHGPPSQFMGTGGNAYCVCYIIDRSGSMVIAFDYVKKEMLRSIQQMQAEQLFHVIFFSAGEPDRGPRWQAGLCHRPQQDRVDPVHQLHGGRRADRSSAGLQEGLRPQAAAPPDLLPDRRLVRARGGRRPAASGTPTARQPSTRSRSSSGPPRNCSSRSPARTAARTPSSTRSAWGMATHEHPHAGMPRRRHPCLDPQRYRPGRLAPGRRARVGRREDPVVPGWQGPLQRRRRQPAGRAHRDRHAAAGGPARRPQPRRTAAGRWQGCRSPRRLRNSPAHRKSQ